jgi:hypothetical protein
LIAIIVYGQDLTPFQKGEKWGFKNGRGKVVVKANYQKAYNLDEKVGLAPVMLNGKWGFIDIKGTLVIPHLYTSIWTTKNYDKKYVFIDGVAEVELNGQKICIDKTGKQVPALIQDFGNHQYAECYAEKRATTGTGTGKMGLVNKSKEIIIPMEYEFLLFSEKDYPIYVQKEKDGKWGYIDLNNEVVIPFKFESVTGFHQPQGENFTEKVARVRLDGVTYYMDKTGNLLGEVNPETLRKMRERAVQDSLKHVKFMAELKQAKEENNSGGNASSGSGSSSASSKVTRIHHCGFCASTVVSEKDPSDRNCPNSMNTAGTHKWKVLGISGNTTYHCKQCNTTIQTEDKSPVYFENCSGKRDSGGNPAGHTWKKQ